MLVGRWGAKCIEDEKFSRNTKKKEKKKGQIGHWFLAIIFDRNAWNPFLRRLTAIASELLPSPSLDYIAFLCVCVCVCVKK